MSAKRPICVLIGAVGGQGGRVFLDWMVAAAALAGYPAQATSIAGVAQRTGATTYYFELFPEREPQSAPVFSLFPDAGEVDLMVALEPAEAARAMSRGWITRDTVVISSLDRIYATAEKIDAGDGRMDLESLEQTLARDCRKLIAFTTPGENRAQLNAMMFGAIAACGVLPLGEDDCRRAVAASGVAVAANLKGFNAGLDLPARASFLRRAVPAASYASAPAGFYADLDRCPEPLRVAVGHALARMIDYQDRAYAALFVARIKRVIEADERAGGDAFGWRLSRMAIERLALWMTYEDAARVAQLKTRSGRLGRIRAEAGAAAQEPLDVIEYLSPAREELMSLLPASIDWIVPRSLTRGIPMRVRSSSPWGYALLKVLAAMRRFRPRTARFGLEQRAIEKWLTAVLEAAANDYELGFHTAELAMWARGYGKVRERGLRALNEIFQEWDRRIETDRVALAAQVERSLERARHDPEAACMPAAQ